IEAEVELPESNYFSIRARADVCGGDPPIIKFSIDDKEVLTLGVNARAWTEYSYTLKPDSSLVIDTPTTSPSDVDQIEQPENDGNPPPEGQPGPLVQGVQTERGDVLQATDEQDAEE